MYGVADLYVTAWLLRVCRLDGPPPLLPTSNIFPLLHLLGAQSHLLLQRAVTTAVAALAHPGVSCCLPVAASWGCPTACQSRGRLPGRTASEDGRMHKQHLQDHNLGMPCQSPQIEVPSCLSVQFQAAGQGCV